MCFGSKRDLNPTTNYDDQSELKPRVAEVKKKRKYTPGGQGPLNSGHWSGAGAYTPSPMFVADVGGGAAGGGGF